MDKSKPEVRKEWKRCRGDDKKAFLKKWQQAGANPNHSCQDPGVDRSIRAGFDRIMHSSGNFEFCQCMKTEAKTDETSKGIKGLFFSDEDLLESFGWTEENDQKPRGIRSPFHAHRTF